MDAKGRRLTVKAKQMEEQDLESVIERGQDHDAGRWAKPDGWRQAAVLCWHLVEPDDSKSRSSLDFS
jgi:phage-related protein